MSNPVLKNNPINFEVIFHTFETMNLSDFSHRPLRSKMIVFFLEFGKVHAEQGALHGHNELDGEELNG